MRTPLLCLVIAPLAFPFVALAQGEEREVPPEVAPPDVSSEPVPDPVPVPVPVPVPDPVPDPQLTVLPDAPALPCSARAREAALDSVVRIRSGNTWGAGFVYHSRRHVVTAFSLVSLGQGVSVVTRDGSQHAARVLARDESADLVVLVLDEELDARPLEPAPESSAMVGRDVVAMGHPFAGGSGAFGDSGLGLLRWSVSRGQIAASNDTAVQADVALTAGHAGGPLLDCEGLLIGMITGAGILSPNIGLVVRTARIDRVIEEAGEGSNFFGDLRPHLGIGGALHADESGRAALGLYLALGVVLFDRVSWMNRVGLFMGGIDGASGDELSVDRQLIRVESLHGYRFFVDLGFTVLYVVPALGAVVAHDRVTTRRAMVTPACVPTADVSCITFEETTVADDWLARPAAGLSFLFGGSLEVGYAIELGLDSDPVRTYHEVRLGLWL